MYCMVPYESAGHPGRACKPSGADPHLIPTWKRRKKQMGSISDTRSIIQVYVALAIAVDQQLNRESRLATLDVVVLGARGALKSSSSGKRPK